MATSFNQSTERGLLQAESTGAAVEAIGGLAVIVLSILGLAGLSQQFLAAIAGIVLGVSLFAQGAAVAAEYHDLYTRLTGGTMGAIELGGGMGVEIVAGAGAIVLGILALINIVPEILLPSLVIAAGATLILSSGTVERLNSLKMAAAETPTLARQVFHTATAGVAAGQLLAGIGAGLLGIIALTTLPAATTAVMGSSSWLTLTLVALLVLGASVMMSGGSLTGRFMQMLNRGGQRTPPQA